MLKELSSMPQGIFRLDFQAGLQIDYLSQQQQ
jgi:hypothetical protein